MHSIYQFDWAGVLSGLPLSWLCSGFVTTLQATLFASVLATVLGGLLAGLRLLRQRIFTYLVVVYIALFRNTPLAVQLLFWYFGGFRLLPESLRDWLGGQHDLIFAGFTLHNPSVELLVAIWGLGLFSAAFIAEELRAGIRAVPKGQFEAAFSQGFGPWAIFREVILPQAIRYAWQPLIGQYLNLMKLSSLAMAIGLAEISYQVRQIESYNFHAVEAFAMGTLIYLGLGLLLSWLLQGSGALLFGSARRA